MIPDDASSAAKNPESDDSRHAVRQSELDRLRRERTNQLGIDDYRTEGNVLVIACGLPTPEIVIGTKDGHQVVQLVGDAAQRCNGTKVGDYVMADGTKESEQKFIADGLSIER